MTQLMSSQLHVMVQYSDEIQVQPRKTSKNTRPYKHKSTVLAFSN